MIEKGMRKVAKTTPKFTYNGNQNRHKIEKCRKNGLPKPMLKLATSEKAQKNKQIGLMMRGGERAKKIEEKGEERSTSFMTSTRPREREEYFIKRS